VRTAIVSPRAPDLFCGVVLTSAFLDVEATMNQSSFDATRMGRIREPARGTPLAAEPMFLTVLL
jgi:hypothetical protein